MEGTTVCSDSPLECSTGLIIQDVECGCALDSLELVVDVGVGSNAMGIVLGGKGSDEDGIGVTVDCHHDVLVATAGVWHEMSRVIHEDAGDGKCVDGNRGQGRR